MKSKMPQIKVPLALKFSHEQWLGFGLVFTVISLLSLVASLTHSSGWSILASTTLIFFIAYPIIWIAWRCYSFWRQAIMQLTTYTQIIREGETNLRFKRQNPNNLLAALQQEISSLAQGNVERLQQKPNIRKRA